MKLARGILGLPFVVLGCLLAELAEALVRLGAFLAGREVEDA